MTLLLIESTHDKITDRYLDQPVQGGHQSQVRTCSDRLVFLLSNACPPKPCSTNHNDKHITRHSDC